MRVKMTISSVLELRGKIRSGKGRSVSTDTKFCFLGFRKLEGRKKKE